ncbi:galactokinase [Parasphingorhabdus halotolerans]|uniref:Galactokinase n=1 Tax=Parasphingorhabdus halotolerans TaxID=2725558 RepID=A0A6H2DPV4_9SPHN|nr:galactokinase [Parasphingorhabdus halotolerans]
MVERVTQAFLQAYGKQPTRLFAAPGRVNLIGEHTDYNDGFVLPCAIDYETIVAISSRDDERMLVLACDAGNAEDSFDPGTVFVAQPEEWKNHVRGVAASFRERGHELAGANVAIAGNVPRGAGLSSSASLGVALATAFAEMNTLAHLTPTDFALIAQQSENDFVGCACGIMDQLVSARAMAGSALLIDCRSLDARPVAISSDVAVLIVHSGIERGLVDSAYNERRFQCQNAAKHYGVAALRDLDMEQMEAYRGNLDALSYRRARHVVAENARTLDAAEALSSGNIDRLSTLMAASHASMRDDFEITTPEIDGLVAMMGDHLGASGGARMTGGGFGGCVVALVARDKLDGLKMLVHERYRTPDGNRPRMFQCTASSGSSRIA